jgi:hypothetical protein
MSKLFKMPPDKLNLFLSVLDSAGFTAEQAEAISVEPSAATYIVASLSALESGQTLPKMVAGKFSFVANDIFVDYKMSRSKRVLEKEFSKGGVSDIFCQKKRWYSHNIVTPLVQPPGKRDFIVKCFDLPAHSGRVNAVMEELGYNPSSHLEGYAFARAFPQLQLLISILVMGSCTSPKGSTYSMCLSSQSGKRIIRAVHFYDTYWPAGTFFLFTRKV